MVTSSLSSVRFEGSEKMLALLKENGVQSAILIEGSNNVTSTIKTLNKKEDGSFDAIMTYEKVTSYQIQNEEKTMRPSPLEGIRIVGSYDSNNKFKVDTIIGKNINESFRLTLTSTLENVQEQIKFPEKPLKVGDKFQQTLPMTIPVGGVKNIQIIVITDYLLKDIKGDIATFDISQNLELNMDSEDSSISATGNGNGTSEYSLSNQFITKYKTDLTMEFEILVNELKVKSEITSISDMTIEIK